ncbi:MAG: FtsW/RodA/SpoVE family cell cycle protein, partial [Dermatophilaceae bacterium]
MTTVTSFRPRPRRNVELVLLLMAVAIVLVAYLNVGLAIDGAFPPDLLKYGSGLLVLTVGFHLVLRWRAPYADPLMLPIATLLNGLGLVMIHRLDLAYDRTGSRLLAPKQLMWSTLAILIAAGVIIILRDHRQLRRFTFTAMALGLGMLLLPLLPGIGRNINGSRIWIGIGPLSFQPGEVAKILLVIFF